MRICRSAALRLCIGLAAAAATAALAPAGAQAAGRRTYIVQLTAKPLASYQGGTRGIPATSPLRTGRKLNRRSAAARAYRTLLDSRQAAVLARLGHPVTVEYSYRTAFAGFSARLSASQAGRLRRAPQVARVEKDRLWKPLNAIDDGRLGGATGDGASYLRLTDPTNGLWDKLGDLGGPRSAGGPGAGVVVGVIDSGIQPGHPSFAASSAGDTQYLGAPFTQPDPSVWHGKCQDTSDFPLSSCNGKLIGARYYLTGFGASNLDTGSFVSPHDDDGHGSHTAATAAGNFGVNPVIGTNDLGVDVISGIAPRAWVAAYKVCWQGKPGVSPSGCTNSDSVKAFDDAVADGVDVINYSVGSSDSAVIGAVEYAALGASDAGVFVANSAGNDGPDPGTVGSPAGVPWVTAVAAHTLHRTFSSNVTFSPPLSGSLIKGASVTGALSAKTVIDAVTAVASGSTAADAELCKPGSLSAAVAGKIVLCKRGSNSRIDKSHNVSIAGGAGMLLYNAADNQELVTDTHFVPTVHITHADGLRVKAAVAADPATTAAFTKGAADITQPNRVLAAFSSRGPQTAVPDIAKPDVSAPGVNILAAAADQPSPASELKTGELFQSISGTSMSSPHVAGAAALLTQAHPTFSSSAIKSALMTTANPSLVKEDGTTPTDPFDVGSGEIDPNRAADPGLVVDATTADYLSYLAAVDPQDFSGTPIAPKDLNVPSISISRLAGTDEVSRKFTSVDGTSKLWAVSITGLNGIAVTPNVTSFVVKPGTSQTVTLGLARTTAPLDAYRFGALVLTDTGGRTVRVPISVKPVAVSAPAVTKVQTAAVAGAQALTVKTGYAGQLQSVGWGLAAPVANTAQRIDTTDGNPNPAGDAGTKVYKLDVPAGAQLLSARISNVDGGDPNTDLDLYVLRDKNGDGSFTIDELVAQSASGVATEAINLPTPAAGKYAVLVTGFTTKPGGTVFDLSTWTVADASGDDPSNAPGLQVLGEPAATTVGGTFPLSLRWSGVGPKGLYLGVVTYHHGGPLTADAADASTLVELTKTADAPGPGGGPGGGTPPPKRLTLKLRSARLVGHRRVLRLRLQVSRAAKVRGTVKQGTRSRARSGNRRLRTAGRTVRLDLRLDHRLRAGRYRVTVVATAGTERVTKRIALRVRR